MLNCLWIVAVDAKLMLTNALFSFCHSYREKFAPFSSRNLTSEIQFGGTTTEYCIDTRSLVTVTFLLFRVSSCPKATGVPSPTISMVQRTALRLLVNFLLNKSPSFVCGLNRMLGCLVFGLDRSLRNQARWYFTLVTSYSGQSTTGLHKTSVFWQ